MTLRRAYRRVDAERTKIAEKMLLKSTKKYKVLTEKLKEVTDDLNASLEIIEKLDRTAMVINRMQDAIEGAKSLIA